MIHVKRLAFLLPILCLSAFLNGCGIGNGKAGRSSSEMDDVREVRIEAEADLLAFAPDGKTLAVYSHGIQLWDAATGVKLCEEDSTATEGGCRFITFSPDGTMLATVHCMGGDSLGKRKILLYLWSVSADKQLGTPQAFFTKILDAMDCGYGIYANRYHVSFSADGRSLAMATPDGTVHVWETDTGTERVQFPGGVAVCFADDGKTLVSVTQGGVIHRWETDTGRVVRLDQDGEPDGFIYVDGVSFDPAAARVAMSDGYAICIKDTETGRTVSRTESRRPMSLGFAPDQTLVVASEGSLQIVDSDTGKARGRIRHETGHGRAPAFSPDGKRVAWSDEKAVLIQPWAAVAGRAEIDMEPVVACEAGSPLKAELIANTDTYELDLGGKTAEEFSNLPFPDRKPPAVDLSFRVRNTGSQPVSLRVWDNESVYSVYLLGNGAFNYSWCPQTAYSGGDYHVKIMSLAPGESFSFPVKEIKTYENLPFWLLPGEYLVHASTSLKVSPPPPGVTVEEDGFGYVHFDAAPAKVKVLAGR